jgi:hypothetical protein
MGLMSPELVDEAFLVHSSGPDLTPQGIQALTARIPISTR